MCVFKQHERRGGHAAVRMPDCLGTVNALERTRYYGFRVFAVKVSSMKIKKHMERIGQGHNGRLPHKETHGVEFPGEPCVFSRDIPAYARNSPAAFILQALFSKPSTPANP